MATCKQRMYVCMYVCNLSTAHGQTIFLVQLSAGDIIISKPIKTFEFKIVCWQYYLSYQSHSGSAFFFIHFSVSGYWKKPSLSLFEMLLIVHVCQESHNFHY